MTEASDRRSAECQVCNEVRELATKAECFRCYRARKREEAAAQPVDRNNPGLRREHQRAFTGFTKVMTGLIDLKATKQDVLRVRELIAPYTRHVQWALSREPETRERELDA